jgi:hypothetical protein
MWVAAEYAAGFSPLGPAARAALIVYLWVGDPEEEQADGPSTCDILEWSGSGY